MAAFTDLCVFRIFIFEVGGAICCGVWALVAQSAENLTILLLSGKEKSKNRAVPLVDLHAAILKNGSTRLACS
jgi:hypothetical protein